MLLYYFNFDRKQDYNSFFSIVSYNTNQENCKNNQKRHDKNINFLNL